MQAGCGYLIYVSTTIVVNQKAVDVIVMSCVLMASGTIIAANIAGKTLKGCLAFHHIGTIMRETDFRCRRIFAKHRWYYIPTFLGTVQRSIFIQLFGLCFHLSFVSHRRSNLAVST